MDTRVVFVYQAIMKANPNIHIGESPYSTGWLGPWPCFIHVGFR